MGVSSGFEVGELGRICDIWDVLVRGLMCGKVDYGYSLVVSRGLSGRLNYLNRITGRCWCYR